LLGSYRDQSAAFPRVAQDSRKNIKNRGVAQVLAGGGRVQPRADL